MSDITRIASALSFVPSDDRGTWVSMGMAVKAELGESGWDLWEEWSRQADSYRPESAKSVWKSIKECGAITVATLFHAAKTNGWHDDASHSRPNAAQIAERKREAAYRASKARAVEIQEEATAARNADALVKSCRPDSHPYLIEKGLPDAKALVTEDGRLVVPMRDCMTNKLNGAQVIKLDNNEWQKKMLFGMRAKGSVLRLGSVRSSESWLVEGYATGLSVSMALNTLRLSACVMVCFSAGNLIHVANLLNGTRFVFADNDASKTGERAAWGTGLPYAIPGCVGDDANDVFRKQGVMALAKLIMETRRK